MISDEHVYCINIPETVPQEGTSMVDMKSNVIGELLQGRDFFSRKVLGYDRLRLGSDVKTCSDTHCNCYQGVDAPSQTKIKISFSFFPTFL